jgi:Peptidase A4 family/Putative Ig domain
VIIITKIAAAAAAAVALAGAGTAAGSPAQAPAGHPGSVIQATGVHPGAVKHISSSTGTLTLKLTDDYADLESSNWSGYVTPEDAGEFTGTTTVFNVPTGITCGGTDTAASFWAGVDGWGDGTVEQDGIEADCNDGLPSLYAWVETYPAYQEEIINSTTGDPVPVEPGDVITSMVTEVSPSGYDLYLGDQTQGWYFSGDLEMPSGYTGQDLTSEVITEATTECPTPTTCQIMPLTDFGSVSYDPAEYWYNGGNSLAFYASSNTTRIDLYQDNAEADGVWPLGSDGAFTVTYGTPRVTVTSPGNQSATEGVAASKQIAGKSSTGEPLSYMASGLPSGLSVNSTTGLISGTPKAAAIGTHRVTVTAADPSGITASASFTWTVTRLAEPKPYLCGTRTATVIEVCWEAVAHATSYSGSLYEHGHSFKTTALHEVFKSLKKNTAYRLRMTANNAAGSSATVTLTIRTKK